MQNEQKRSRKKASAVILLFSSLRQITQILVSFLSRTVFIYILGAEYLGLNGLFTNILSFLALSELGISVTITFWLYTPIANGEKERIHTLMGFYAVCYRIIGCTIIGLGLLLVPFLHHLINFDQPLPINLYAVYLLFLFNSAATYLLFAYKQTIFSADQKQDALERVNILFAILGCTLDIILLLIFKAFIPYLIGKIVLTLAKNIWIGKLADKKYPYIKGRPNVRLKHDEVKKFFSGLYHVFIFKVGSQLIDSSLTIIMSVIIGTTIVGHYSNYHLLYAQITGIYMLFIISLKAGVGNVLVYENKKKAFKLYNELNFLGFTITVPLCMGFLYAVNPFIRIWLGGLSDDYVLEWRVVLLITASLYCSLCAQVINLFREGSGQFNVGSHFQIIAGVVNVVLSIVLGKWLGLFGIILSLVLCKYFIIIIPFIYNCGRQVFDKSGLAMVFGFIKQAIVCALCGVITFLISQLLPQNGLIGFLAQGIVAIAISIGIISLIYWRSQEFIALKERAEIIWQNIKRKPHF